ncbi:MAG: cell division protein FtsB [Gammaproteobacteria bacterium]
MNGRNLLVTLLLVVLAVLTYRLWLADNGYQEVRRLKQDIEVRQAEVEAKQKRNRELKADVKDLKEGVDAVEERARTELGMTRKGETFVQIVTDEEASAESPP